MGTSASSPVEVEFGSLLSSGGKDKILDQARNKIRTYCRKFCKKNNEVTVLCEQDECRPENIASAYLNSSNEWGKLISDSLRTEKQRRTKIVVRLVIILDLLSVQNVQANRSICKQLTSILQNMRITKEHLEQFWTTTHQLGGPYLLEKYWGSIDTFERYLDQYDTLEQRYVATSILKRCVLNLSNHLLPLNRRFVEEKKKMLDDLTDVKLYRHVPSKYKNEKLNARWRKARANDDIDTLKTLLSEAEQFDRDAPDSSKRNEPAFGIRERC